MQKKERYQVYAGRAGNDKKLMAVSLELREAGPWNYWWWGVGGSAGGEDMEREDKDEWTVLE